MISHHFFLNILNNYFHLVLDSPGGRLRPGESEIDGLKRKLTSKLSPTTGFQPDWEIGDMLCHFWRPNFETLLVCGRAPSCARV